MLRNAVGWYAHAFRGLSREIWLLSLVTFINRSGTMVLPFLAIYLTHKLGFDLQQVSLILGAFGLGSLVGSWIGGKLTDRFGHFAVQFWSLFLSGFLFMGLIYIQGFWPWLISIFVLSTVADAFRPAAMASIAVYSKPENRTRSLSLFRLAINLGFAGGPAIGGLLAETVGYQSLFIADGLTCIAAALVFRTFLPNKEDRAQNAYEEEQERLTRTGRALPPHRNATFIWFLVFNMLTALSFIQLFHSVPLYLKDHFLLSEWWIGLLMAFNGLLVFLVEMPLVFAVENRVNHYKLVAFGACLIAISFGLFLLAPAWVGISVLVIAGLSIGEILFFPFTNTVVMNQTNPLNRGQYMGLYAMAFSGSHVLAPIVGMQLIDLAGFPVLWAVTMLISLVATGGYLRLWRRNSWPASVQPA